ncbi:hypothetical protein S40293_01970 [Stachybotrys chartarum IBT 40293]|nr:hypothetical protein S40293_01970 [Stachybotrys chartarum IBT 40293]
MATAAARNGDDGVEALSPTNKTAVDEPSSTVSKSLEPRADPDAQTTVTDFLDFTDYLPSDMMRSLTLIGKLDKTYEDASLKVHDLTKLWGQLPSLAAEERPTPARLRADISEQLNQAVSSRVFAHAEAVRMSDNVNRHYNKAKVLLAKLQTMMQNYPTEEQRSPTLVKSPQLVRAKTAARTGGDAASRVRRHRVPRITVPGEVLAPYDLEYDTYTEESDSSSDEESDEPAAAPRTPGPAPKIKLVTNKTPKTNNRPSRPAAITPTAMSAAAAANAAALANPPPENAVIGSADAPWLQLTQYELAKLRKRMKKNAAWTPSETMIARELKNLNRGPEAYKEAKLKAEEAGKTFDAKVPAPVVDDDSGTPQLPAGAISVDSLAGEVLPTSNRGMKLNEAKKMKREALAKLAAEDAEESARKMEEAAKLIFGNTAAHISTSGSAKDATSRASKSRSSRSSTKRKRETEGETAGEAVEGSETPRPQLKRTKTETPVPPPHQPALGPKVSSPETAVPQMPAAAAGGGTMTPTETPVPIPIPGQGSSIVAATRSATSPSTSVSSTTVTGTSVSVRPPAAETPVPLPMPDIRKSATPIAPPAQPRESTKRETRGDAAKRTQQQQHLPVVTPVPPPQVGPEPAVKQPPSRTATPRTTPAPDGLAGRRPGSRGKAMSQEPQPATAVDRPRRTSTARNTPAPEVKQPNKRTKRPAPGIVSTTSSGGNSAVGKRKAAPRKKARATRKDKGQTVETEMEEVDDEGNPIDPNEPRYCLCNRVSFGTMIQCDNPESCKQEWFHLECVGLNEIPARTTKWYCPDCRKLLNIGERGEVNARGIRK